MISKKLEVQTDFDYLTDSENQSMATTDSHSSTSKEQSSRSRAGTEPKKKLKKLRSTKISVFPRSKQSRGNTIKQEQSQASLPCNSVSFFDTDESNLAPPGSKVLTRKASLKTNRILVKKKLKHPNSEGMTPFREISESKLYQSCENLSTHQPKSNHSVKKLKKTTSIRPVRIFTKMVSMKSKRPSNMSVNRVTCSSTLKSSRDGSELEGDSIKKVCPYTYCSLHGHHHHAPVPPLKRFISLKRRSLRNQKSQKPETLPQVKIKHSVSKATDRKFQASSGSEITPGRASESNCITSVSDKTQLENKRHVRMWRLIYHSVLASKIGKQLNNGEDEDTPVEDGSRSTSDRMDMEENDAGLQKVEFGQADAIKLVEEAIDGILLPEIQDQSSDDQSISSGMSSVDGVPENNNYEGGKLICLKSTVSSKDDLKELEGINEENNVMSYKEDTLLAANGVGTSEEIKNTERTRETNQKIPKNWSKLKKIIVLRRFMKALDKVRELKFRENQYQPLEPDQEAERVNLRHQTMDNRKLAEEWMLDYALRQVVSKLSPARRRKVELLIEAFETVIPVSESVTLTRNNSAITEEHDKHVIEAPYMELKEETKMISNVDSGEGNFILSDDQHKLEDSGSPELMVPHNGKRTLEVHEEINSTSRNGENLEIEELSGISGRSSARYTSPDIDDAQQKPEMIYEVSSSASTCNKFVDCTASGKEKTNPTERNHEFIEELPTPRYCKPDSNTQADETQLEKEKYFKMWQTVYNHVVSGSAANIGIQIQITEAGESIQVDDANISGTCQSFSETDKHGGVENCNAEYKNKLSQIDAIKLVEDAIDEVVLPESQDESSNDRSITSDQDHLVMVCSAGGDTVISTSTNSPNDLREPDEIKKKIIQKTWWKVGNTSVSEQHETTAKGESKNNQRTNGWSNLKKFILLKRFIKALEKVNKFNPREPRYLPLEPDLEAEEVRLRHQTAEERLSMEEWMVDRALQQVVARLTPARKRRVELLVEAFETLETVLPLSENKNYSKWNAADSTNAKPIQTRSWPPR